MLYYLLFQYLTLHCVNVALYRVPHVIIVPLFDVVLFSCWTILMLHYVMLHYFDIELFDVEPFNVTLFDLALY